MLDSESSVNAAIVRSGNGTGRMGYSYGAGVVLVRYGCGAGAMWVRY